MAVSNVELRVDARNAIQALQQVNRASKETATATNQLKDALANLGSQLALADLARRYFKGFQEAQKAAAAVRTLGVDSKALEERLLGVSNRLDGLYSQTQLLTAAYDVASAGFANAADNAKVLEAAAKGATGGLSDINTVGNAVTSVLNAYGKSANDAAALVDGFIQTQNDGKIILNEYAQLIGRLAPSAAAAGVGINELNAAVATITAQGVPAEATFTGLNQALVSILKPSAEATELAQKLGIDFNEAGLRAKGFGGLLEDVKTKTGGSTTALVKLFGSVDALKAVLPLVNDDLVKYNQNLDKQAKASGVADRATEELGGTVSSEITKMVNQIGNLTRALDTVLGPALGGIVRLINAVIAQATRGIQVLGQLFSMSKNTAILKTALEAGDLRGAAAARAIPGIDELIGASRRQELARQAGAGTGFLGLGMNAQKFAELLKKEPQIKNLLGAGGTVTNKPPGAGTDPAVQAILDQLAKGGGGGKGAKDKAAREAERAAEAARKEAERVAEVIRSRTAEGQIIQLNSELRDRIAAAEMVGDKMLAARLQGQQRELDLQFRYAQELAQETDTRAQQAIIYKAQNELVANQRDLQRELNDLQKQGDQDRFNALQKHIEQQYELNTGVKQQQALADGVASTLGQTMTSAFDALITGANDWGTALRQIASGALVEIAQQLLRIYVIEQAINAIRTFLTPFNPATPLGAGGGMVGRFGTFGPNYGIPQRAMGGSVRAGQPYLVGERGPELFMPGRSGGIAPTGSFGGGVNVVVNVDAAGSSVQGNEPNANQLGRLIGSAVQAEIVKQQRPGGLLAGSR
jgi:TP901 family phage tail tape measure protein